MNPFLKEHKRLLSAISLALVMVSVGTFIFPHLENWSYVDSFYFSTVTLTTIGYGDITPKTDVGKIFTSLYAFFGIGIMLYILGSVVGEYASKHEEYFDKAVSAIHKATPQPIKTMLQKKKRSDEYIEIDLNKIHGPR